MKQVKLSLYYKGREKPIEEFLDLNDDLDKDEIESMLDFIVDNKEAKLFQDKFGFAIIRNELQHVQVNTTW